LWAIGKPPRYSLQVLAAKALATAGFSLLSLLQRDLYTKKQSEEILFMDKKTAAVGAANTSYGVTRGALALRFSQGSCPNNFYKLLSFLEEILT